MILKKMKKMTTMKRTTMCQAALRKDGDIAVAW